MLPELLECVDNKRIVIMAGVHLSPLDERTQKAANNYLVSTGFKKISAKAVLAIQDEFEKQEASITIKPIKEIIEEKNRTSSMNRSKSLE